MTDGSRQRGLGRGLSALMSDLEPSGPSRQDERRVAIELLIPNPDQPRRDFAESGIEDLAASIRDKGVLQPLIVRAGRDPGTYEIVAGERRWRAAQRAGLHDVPILLRDYSDTEVLEIAIVENIQRADLNPMEEASAFRQLMTRFGHTQEQLASSLSKSRSYIANALRLLTLPDDVQSMVRSAKLSAGHARALAAQDDASELAARVVGGGLSVRATEDLVRRHTNPVARRRARRGVEDDPDLRAIEQDLSANLRMGIRITHEPGGERGTLTITYASLTELDNICRILSHVDRKDFE